MFNKNPQVTMVCKDADVHLGICVVNIVSLIVEESESRREFRRSLFTLRIHQIQKEMSICHLHIGFQPKEAYAEA